MAQTLQDRHSSLSSQLEERRIKDEIAIMESLVGEQAVCAPPVWNAIPGLRESFNNDSNDDWNEMTNMRRQTIGSQRNMSFSTVYDRADGRYLPFYEIEMDLHRTRKQARNVALWAATAVGIGNVLNAYVINNGFNVSVEPKNDKSKKLASDLEFVIDDIHRNNKQLECIEWQKDLHDDTRVDGEKIIAIYPDTTTQSVRIGLIDSTEIKEPMSDGPLNTMLGLDDYGPYRAFWDFGVLTVGNPDLRLNGPKDIAINDLSNPIGYHICYDDSGESWDYVPDTNAVHIKRNVPFTAKRGWSDYAIIIETMEREVKLTRNLAEGASIQSAIAYIQERAAGQTVPNSITGADITNITKRSADGGSFSTKKKTFYPGEIPNIPNGYKFHYGPLGQPHSSIYVEVAKYLERMGGKLWNIPAFMITGDTETALFNAVLAIGSPFVNARQMDQQFYSEALREMYVKAIDIYIQNGWYPTNISIDELLENVTINVTGSDITIEDSKNRAERQAIEIASGTLSMTSAMEEAGRDPELELERIEEQGGIPDTRPSVGDALDSMMRGMDTKRPGAEDTNNVERAV